MNISIPTGWAEVDEEHFKWLIGNLDWRRDRWGNCETYFIRQQPFKNREFGMRVFNSRQRSSTGITFIIVAPRYYVDPTFFPRSGWVPTLSEKQTQVFDGSAKTVTLTTSRWSGKTMALIHAMMASVLRQAMVGQNTSLLGFVSASEFADRLTASGYQFVQKGNVFTGNHNDIAWLIEYRHNDLLA